MAEISLKKKELKNLLIELLEEDQVFFQKIMTILLLQKDSIDFFYKLNYELLLNYFDSKASDGFEPLIDREKYKFIITKNYEFLDSLYQKKISPKKSTNENKIEYLKKKYAIKKDAIKDLQNLWKNEPPASELVKMLNN